MQMQLRWLMAAVLVAALLLSLPGPLIAVGGIIGATLAVVTLVPAGLAPRGRRVEAASWGFILHPLVLLAWLQAWRLCYFRGPLGYRDQSTMLSVVLEIPYLLAILSLGYAPAVALLGCIALACDYRRWLDTARFLAYLLIWMTTVLILAADPFDLYDWVRD